jgi:hypothetical protein
MIKEISAEFNDKDGNFIQQFQSTGFQARLWELFLYMFFKENGFEILYDKNTPDFHLKKADDEIYVEASISNEKEDDIYTEEEIKKAIESNNTEIEKELIENYIMRMGSVLYSKLNKKYWELEWVKDKPIIIAISPFHNYIASFIPDAKIIEYLYGISYITEITDKGLELKEIRTVEKHTYKEKEIPSNYFEHENTEHISAVIFTNNSDINKFHRMGYQKGLVKDEIFIVRGGVAHDPTPGSEGRNYELLIESGKELENWSDSVSIFHNPNAIHKLDRNLFEGVRQVWLDDKGKLDGYMPDFFAFIILYIEIR